MTFSGFYSVYTFGQAKKKTEEKIQDEEFWARVRERRKMRQGKQLSVHCSSARSSTTARRELLSGVFLCFRCPFHF